MDFRTYYIKESFEEIVHIGNYYTTELYKNPSRETIQELGEPRGVVLGNGELWVWSKSIDAIHKDDEIDHRYLINQMHWTYYIPIILAPPHTVKYSSWWFKNSKLYKKIDPLESLVNNEYLKSIDYTLIIGESWTS